MSITFQNHDTSAILSETILPTFQNIWRKPDFHSYLVDNYKT